MSRANANNKNNPANRGIGGHIKEGLKNVPKMYDALYNAKTPQGAKLGVKNTVSGNVKKVLTGKSNATAGTKTNAGTRAAIVGAGASSVTPLGPIVAIGLGIAKSVKDKKDAKALNPPTPKTPKVKPQPTPQQVQKAKDLKKTLNNAFPGLNMK
jgi:hypothetical protein